MGYPVRDERPGTMHHVGTRGNNGRPIVVDDESRTFFLLHLAAVVRVYGWTLVSYCLMDNHYHLIIELGNAGLARGMQHLNGRYAIAFNIRYRRRDHLFGRRYWNREIEDDTDLLETSRYIDLNPCRKGFVAHPAEWRWSGYRATVGLATTERFHSPSGVWGLFDKRPRLAMDAYRRYVDELPIEPCPVSDTRSRIGPRPERPGWRAPTIGSR